MLGKEAVAGHPSCRDFRKEGRGGSPHGGRASGKQFPRRDVRRDPVALVRLVPTVPWTCHQAYGHQGLLHP